jgi:hypothetical protein
MQLNLTPTSDKPPDFYNLIAQRRGCPPGWHWYSLEGKGEDRKTGVAIVKGAVCDAVYTRGPNKGHRNWSKRDRATERELVITFVEYDEVVAEWTMEHSK